MSTPVPVPQVSPFVLALVGLRGVALALTLSGNGKIANGLYALADAAEAGRNVDAHMAAVAEKLKSRSANPDDWAEVVAAIEADSDRLQT
jgi:hypothetical protein